MGELAPEQIDRFFERGWIVLPDRFSSDELDRLARAFDRLHRVAQRVGRTAHHRGAYVVTGDVADGSDVPVHRVVWCGALEEELSRVGRDPRLLGPAAELLGSREMVWLINQAHFKLPGDGVAFPWHQDSVHRRYGGGEWRDVNGRGSYVQTVLAIDDVTPDNGPIELLPGSGRWGHLEPPPGRVGWLPLDRVNPAEARVATMPRGSVLLFGPFVFHRSRPNRSARPRRVLINGFASPGANGRVYPGAGLGRPLRAG